jgi:hypothetical protein
VVNKNKEDLQKEFALMLDFSIYLFDLLGRKPVRAFAKINWEFTVC